MPDLTASQQSFLNQNRPHYETLLKAQFITNLDYSIKNGLMEAANVFQPGYKTNLWCGPCVIELVKLVYTQYDKWLSENSTSTA